jgi:hypothetical protein
MTRRCHGLRRGFGRCWFHRHLGLGSLYYTALDGLSGFQVSTSPEVLRSNNAANLPKSGATDQTLTLRAWL